MSKFSNLIDNSPVPVLVDFYADWCGPCKMMAPILEKVSDNMAGKVKIIKVDVDKNQAVSQKYNIRSIPTMILFHKGKTVWRHSGTITQGQLEKELLQKIP